MNDCLDGAVSETGTYQQLITGGGAFAEFLEEYLIEEAKQRTASESGEADGMALFFAFEE